MFRKNIGTRYQNLERKSGILSEVIWTFPPVTPGNNNEYDPLTNKT